MEGDWTCTVCGAKNDGAGLWHEGMAGDDVRVWCWECRSGHLLDYNISIDIQNVRPVDDEAGDDADDDDGDDDSDHGAETQASADFVDFAVYARAWSDDRHCEIEFDAVRWLQTATDEAVIALADDNWERGYGADAVALHSTLWDAGCQTLQDYVTAHNAAAELSGKEGIGFECSVHKRHALRWLKANRPLVFRELQERDQA